jgi:FkbM family methyltransferase
MGKRTKKISGADTSIKLPNGFDFYLPSQRMKRAAQFLAREIFHKKRYHKEGFEIRETDTIVDIGSNMGLFVMWVAPAAARGNIIAVEPTDSIHVLEENLKRNDIRNVKPLKVAVGPDGSHVDIITYPGFNVINHQADMRPTLFTKTLVYLLTSQWKCKREIRKVPTISLGKLIDENNLDRIDLLKMDAEGCEYEAFRNISDGHLRKIKKIALEFHEYHPDNNHEELSSILRDKGFKVKVVKPWFDYYLVGKCGFIWAWR